jgi:hypothetical protein
MNAEKFDELKSCLPIDAFIANDKPQIEWLDLTGIGFHEPFFHQTVEKARARRPEIKSVFTDVDALLRTEHFATADPPTGFIFHTSRCGSTLVANACRVLEASRVIAEPPVVDKLISRLFTDAEPDSAKELLYLTLIKSAVRSLAPVHADFNQRFFLKFACASILQIKLIRRIWPTVPFLVLYRHPLEITVSNLRNLPQWMRSDNNAAASAAIAGVTEAQLQEMSNEEFCARALGRYYSAAESVWGDPFTFLVDYDQLSLKTIGRILEFFGAKVSTEEYQAIQESMQLHAKDATRPFQPDGLSKKASASSYAIEMVQKWAMPGYRSLGSLTSMGNG